MKEEGISYRKCSSVSTCSSGTDEVSMESPSDTHDTNSDSDTYVLDD